jgi:anionic cell wall polymer biosynthesis LytR-Cps2A-Psr (LCP) family protein
MMAFQALRDQRLWPRNTEAGAAGTRTLDGTEALAYVRYRAGPTADLGRIGRQQRFLQDIDGIAYWVPDREAGQRVVDQTVR